MSIFGSSVINIYCTNFSGNLVRIEEDCGNCVLRKILGKNSIGGLRVVNLTLVQEILRIVGKREREGRIKNFSIKKLVSVSTSRCSARIFINAAQLALTETKIWRLNYT